MASKLNKLTIKALQAGQTLSERGLYVDHIAGTGIRFRINVMIDGQRVSRVVGWEHDGTTLDQARAYLEQIRTEARHGRLKLPKGRKLPLLFEQAAQNYLNRLEESDGKDLKAKRRRLRDHLTPFFGKTPLAQIAEFDLERYCQQRRKAGAKPATINREMAVLSHLFGKATSWGWMEPVRYKLKRLREDNIKDQFLTEAEINRLLQAAREDLNPYTMLFILIGLETSMRRSEIVSIEKDRIDIERGVILIPMAKAGARIQPMTPRLGGFLKAYLEQSAPNERWLFPSKASQNGHAHTMYSAFRRVVIAAGLDPKKVTPHSMRHTAITNMALAGVDSFTIKQFSGHKTIQMVERYTHPTNPHLKRAMEKLEAQYAIKGFGKGFGDGLA